MEKSVKLITDEKQLKYFTGYTTDFGYLFIEEEKSILFIDARYFEAAKNLIKTAEVRLYTAEDMKNYFLSTGAASIGVDYTVTTVAELEDIKKRFGVETYDISEFVADKMIIKSEEELAKIRFACEITEKAFYLLLDKVRTGITERQLAAELEYIMKSLGAEKTSFDTIVAFGANSAVPHHFTGDTALQPNQNVLIDFGAEYGGYAADMTRNFFYGTPDEKYVKVYSAVLEANETCIAKTVEGKTGKETHELAVDILKKHGFDKYFTHGLGHGVGVHIHELPHVNPRGDKELKDGMVFTIEPGVYLNGEFGVRIEDTVYMQGGKTLRMFKDDKKLLTIKER